MGRTVAIPEMAGLVDLVGNISAQVTVRRQNHLRFIERSNDLNRIGAGATDIALGFNGRTGVNVSDDRNSGMAAFHLAQTLGGNHVGHWAASIQPGEQHGFFRSQDSSTFSHEMNSTEDNH